MKLANRAGEARKQIRIIEENLAFEDEDAARAVAASIGRKIEGLEAALEEADL